MSRDIPLQNSDRHPDGSSRLICRGIFDTLLNQHTDVRSKEVTSILERR
jgi:hypothetical protein